MAQQNRNKLTIPFTKPFLPSLDTYQGFTEEIWKTAWITNQGPLVSRLEDEMASFLGVEYVSFVSSGTMGLQLAIKCLGNAGEIITTPYSYVATTSAIVWQGFKPVFADISTRDFNIEPDAVESLINPNTKAILATHVYGNPCDVERLSEISEKHNIPVIYDGAHCFGTNYRNQSIFKFGDYAVLSTHATKLFHTANGGFVVARTKEAKERIDRLKNFGHNGQNEFEGIGINGKNSEFHAALGLALMRDAELLIGTRVNQWNFYHEALKDSQFGILTRRDPHGYNGAYFPVICLSKEQAESLIIKGAARGIELRRYFAPSLNRLPYAGGQSCPKSEMISERVLCLPMYHEMTQENQEKVLEVLK
jgi:dTDP-4-amino-4,6-dideoxygalactose transaminase